MPRLNAVAPQHSSGNRKSKRLGGVPGRPSDKIQAVHIDPYKI